MTPRGAKAALLVELALVACVACAREPAPDWDFSLRHLGGLVAHACEDPIDPGTCGAAAVVVNAFEKWLAAGPVVYAPPACAASITDPSGLWHRSSSVEEEATLEIGAGTDGAHRVGYWTSGHVSDQSFERRAVLVGPELRLGGPVSSYGGTTYHQLFAVLLEDRLYLVPGPSARFVTQAAGATECSKVDVAPFGGSLFSRVAAEAADAPWRPPAADRRRSEPRTPR